MRVLSREGIKEFLRSIGKLVSRACSVKIQPSGNDDAIRNFYAREEATGHIYGRYYFHIKIIVFPYAPPSRFIHLRDSPASAPGGQLR